MGPLLGCGYCLYLLLGSSNGCWDDAVKEIVCPKLGGVPSEVSDELVPLWTVVPWGPNKSDLVLIAPYQWMILSGMREWQYVADISPVCLRCMH
jgi:hypothetical protein